MDSERFSLRSRLRSFRFAFRGIILLIRQEHNARIHLFAALTVVVLGILLKVSHVEWIFLTLIIGLVFICELFNSSVERLSDTIQLERSEKIRDVKDYAAGAVLISAVISAIVGAIIFLPKILNLFNLFI
jgi:diacylglycerol kinase